MITRQFKCTKESFKPQETKGVRWLAPNADFYRFQQFLRTQKSECPSVEEWLDWYANGIVFCGYLEAGNLRALAAVIKKDQPDWELAEVQTLEAFRNKGFATATCAFIASYALNHRSEITYLLGLECVAMEQILAKLGFVEVFADSSEQPN